MASSSSQQGAREAPPPNQLAAFYSLADKIANAGALSRHSRNAELAARAVSKAEALFPDDSLVVAHLRMSESNTLVNLAATSSGAEKHALFCRSLSALLSLIELLQTRLTVNTLLPGAVRKEETEYYAHVQAARFAAKCEPVPPLAALHGVGSLIGYSVLLDALNRGLHFLDKSLQSWWPAEQQNFVKPFVLQALDVIPHTAGWIAVAEGEKYLVTLITEDMSPQKYEPAFCAAVLRKWRSDAVSSVLRARGVLQTGVVDAEQSVAAFDARQREDIAKHGLRDCALPACFKTEKTVKEFAHCSGCRSVVYCCAEHQGLHWTKHKKACREREAARLAAEESEGSTGAGRAAA